MGVVDPINPETVLTSEEPSTIGSLLKEWAVGTVCLLGISVAMIVWLYTLAQVAFALYVWAVR